jgi:hypothetical protein
MSLTCCGDNVESVYQLIKNTKFYSSYDDIYVPKLDSVDMPNTEGTSYLKRH